MELPILEARLSLLRTGQAELLTATQFDIAFPNLPTVQDQKAEAIRLADRHGCEVRFIGHRDGFAVFTRTDGRAHGPSPSRAKPA